MEYGATIGLVTTVLAVACVVGLIMRSNRLAAKRLQEIIPEIEKCYAALDKLSCFDSGYLMRKDWRSFIISATPTLNAVSKIPKRTIKVSPYANQISCIVKCCTDSSFQEKRNEKYKARELELCDELFSDIDGGKSLDPQQRDAVVTDEYSNLVIAGAGSGKTSVVVGKVKYLVERWGGRPRQYPCHLVHSRLGR